MGPGLCEQRPMCMVVGDQWTSQPQWSLNEFAPINAQGHSIHNATYSDLFPCSTLIDPLCPFAAASRLVSRLRLAHR